MSNENTVKDEPRAAYTFSVPLGYRAKLKTLQRTYGYRRESDAAVNLLRVGLKVHETSPTKFFELLNESIED